MKTVSAWVGGTIIVIVLLVALFFVGWYVGWWIKTETVKKEAHIYRTSFGHQESLRERAATDYIEVTKIETQISELTPEQAETKAKLEAQAEAVMTTVCKDLGEVEEQTPQTAKIAVLCN